MTTPTGWLKDDLGNDVYTDDGEWYWRARTEDWIHDPALLTHPSGEPLSAKIAREKDRLSTGWPSVRSAVIPFSAAEDIQGFGWKIAAGIVRGWLLFLIGYEYILRGQIIGMAHILGWWFYNAWNGGIWIFISGGDSKAFAEAPVPSWANTYDGYETAGFFTLCFVPMVIIPIVLLYLLRTYDVDEHKGNVMAAGIGVWSIAHSLHRHHLKEQEAQIKAFAAEMDKRL